MEIVKFYNTFETLLALISKWKPIRKICCIIKALIYAFRYRVLRRLKVSVSKNHPVEF